MLKTKVLMPLAAWLLLGSLAGMPVWAFPSYGDYEFTSGLQGTFTVGDTGSGVSGLTAWNFFDGFGVIWSSSNPNQNATANSAGYFHSESGIYLDGCINPFFYSCEIDMFFGSSNEYDVWHDGLVGIIEFGLPFDYRMVSGPPAPATEPGTLALLGLGLAGLGLSRRRKTH